MSCGSDLATLFILAQTCVRASQTFELAQAEWRLKCGAVMLLQLKSVSVDLHAIFSFISVSLSCFTCVLISSLDLEDKWILPLNSFKASTP